MAKAQADLTQVTALTPTDAYALLWLNIVDKRSRLPSPLVKAAEQIDKAQWPAPIVRLVLGQMTREATLAAADDPNAETKKRRVCEVNFFAGALALERNAKDEAARMFRLALADCRKDDVEFYAAKAELRALGAQP
jgi:lipoprotein NlpI